MLADWAFVRRPHAFRAARQAAPAIPPACLPRGAPSRAGAWREIVLRFCANYISYYWICANSYWPLLDLQEELLANLRISIFCKKLSLQFSNFFLQISYFRLREETLLANFEILQLCKKLPFRAAHQVVPAMPPARHIKPPRQYRPRGTHKVVPAIPPRAVHQAVPAIPPARHINLPVRLPSAAPHQISTPAARMSSRLLRCTSAFAEDVQSDKTIVR